MVSCQKDPGILCEHQYSEDSVGREAGTLRPLWASQTPTRGARLADTLSWLEGQKLGLKSTLNLHYKLSSCLAVWSQGKLMDLAIHSMILYPICGASFMSLHYQFWFPPDVADFLHCITFWATSTKRKLKTQGEFDCIQRQCVQCNHFCCEYTTYSNQLVCFVELGYT